MSCLLRPLLAVMVSQNLSCFIYLFFYDLAGVGEDGSGISYNVPKLEFV